jgi:hypothetical protein
MREDPTADVAARLTRTGRVLRDYSLDHVPMLMRPAR